MLIRLLFYIVLAGIVILVLPRIITGIYAFTHTYSAENVPAQRVAIIFGAGLQRDGTPTAVLRDRVEMGVQLYFSGKVEKLLMSGDNRFVYYNEPESMRQYAIQLGVPDEDIVLDYAGRRTYDTCYRAKAIFGLSEAILVTQSFHLPRAIYLCNMLGVDGVGVSSDLQYYRKVSRFFWHFRELPATLTALVEVHLTHPLPVLGNPEPIFKTDQGLQ